MKSARCTDEKAKVAHLRLAAERIDAGYANYIGSICFDGGPCLHDEVAAVFCQRDNPNLFDFGSIEIGRKNRVLALCFMAAMVEAGDA